MELSITTKDANNQTLVSQIVGTVLVLLSHVVLQPIAGTCGRTLSWNDFIKCGVTAWNIYSFHFNRRDHCFKHQGFWLPWLFTLHVPGKFIVCSLIRILFVLMGTSVFARFSFYSWTFILWATTAKWVHAGKLCHSSLQWILPNLWNSLRYTYKMNSLFLQPPRMSLNSYSLIQKTQVYKELDNIDFLFSFCTLSN